MYLYKVILFGVGISFFIFSCSKMGELEPEKDNLICENQSEFHFSGIINDSLKCFNDGVNNYQRYSGSITSYFEGSRFVIGMDTYPVGIGDEFIFLRTPVVATEDPEQISSLFPIRELTIGERSEFKLTYNNVLKVENGHPQEIDYLFGDFEDDSSKIEVLDFSITQSNPNSIFKVKIIINCKLFDRNGQLKSELVSGELTGLIYANDNN